MLDVSERAAALIGLDRLRRMARPAGPLGVSARDHAQPMGREERAAWMAERAACAVVARAREATPDAFEGIGERLASAESVVDALCRAAAGDADETDLFRLDRFMYAAWRVVAELKVAGASAYEQPPMTAEELERVVRTLCGEREPGARFALRSGFDGRLEPLRTRLNELRRDRRRQARARREEIEARWGVRVQRARVRLPAGHPELPAMRASDDFEEAAAGPLEVELQLRDSPSFAELSAKVAATETELDTVEAEVIARLGRVFEPVVVGVEAMHDWLGRLDFRLAKVRLSDDWPAWPEPAEETSVVGAWLPEAREDVVACGGAWQPLDLRLGPGLTLVSGPNMGGKTAALAVIATVQTLAQLGYPAPAGSATFRWVDRVDYIGGEMGSFATGLSSFAGEVAAFGAALEASGDSVLLVDELGKGTSPAEGKAVAAAAARHLVAARHSTMLVTHFAALAPELKCRRLRVVGLGAADDAALRTDAAHRGWKAALNSAMDFRLVDDDGTQVGSDALRIASLLNLPVALVADARASLGQSDE